jgi:hypothetical protein
MLSEYQSDVRLEESFRVVLAKKIDDGQISEEDAQLQFAQITAQVSSIEQMRM